MRVRTLRWLLPTLFAAVAFHALFGLIVAKTQHHVDALALLRGAPRASLSNPAAGPAIYAGHLRGPATRVDPVGKSAAGFWWWVDERVSKNNWKNVCFFREIQGMRLTDGATEKALRMFDGKESLTLVASTRTDDYKTRLVVDLGYEQAVLLKKMPVAAEGCAGTKREYVGRSIPPAASVELFACAEGGELRPCATGPSAVLVLGTMAQHRDRRASEAAKPFVVLGMVTLLVLVGLLLLAVVLRHRTFEIVSTKGVA